MASVLRPKFWRGLTADAGIAVEWDQTIFDAEVLTLLGQGERNSSVPWAAAQALTWTAKDAQIEGRREIRAVYDRPTRWTQNALFTWPAKASDGDAMSAGVYLKDDVAEKGARAGRYLGPTIRCGRRRAKAHEKLLMRKKIIAPNERLVPGPNMPLDAHGNVKGGVIVQMLSQLQALGETGYTANETVRSKAAKAAKRGHRKWFVAEGVDKSAGFKGIFYRAGKGGPPILAFRVVRESAIHYRVMFPFRAFMRRVVAERAPRMFELAARDVIARREARMRRRRAA